MHILLQKHFLAFEFVTFPILIQGKRFVIKIVRIRRWLRFVISVIRESQKFPISVSRGFDSSVGRFVGLRIESVVKVQHSDRFFLIRSLDDIAQCGSDRVRRVRLVIVDVNPKSGVTSNAQHEDGGGGGQENGQEIFVLRKWMKKDT